MTTMQPLTRKAFYDLAGECHAFAMRLATRDANTVDRALCGEFNQFLARVRAFDRLGPRLGQLQPARPLTRGMVLAVALAFWLLWATVGVRVVPQFGGLLGLGASVSLIFLVFLIPPRVYGTSVEALEGGVLAVVEALLALLESGDMEFTEAAYFQVRETLREAAMELRQQVYLNRGAR